MAVHHTAHTLLQYTLHPTPVQAQDVVPDQTWTCQHRHDHTYKSRIKSMNLPAALFAIFHLRTDVVIILHAREAHPVLPEKQ